MLNSNSFNIRALAITDCLDYDPDCHADINSEKSQSGIKEWINKRKIGHFKM